VIEDEFRDLVRRSLRVFNSAVEQAIRAQLARQSEPRPGTPIFFVVGDDCYDIWLIEGFDDGTILSPGILERLGSWYFDADEAYHLGVKPRMFNARDVVAQELLSWLADRWGAVEGPARFGPAFVFWGGLPPMSRIYTPLQQQPSYDLQTRRWVWDKAPPPASSPSGDIPF